MRQSYMITATFTALIRLHLRIAGRFLRRYHKEVAVLIVVLAWFDTLAANGVEHNFPYVLSWLSVAGLATLQLRRKDRRFLTDVLPNVRFFLLVENLALAVPIAILLVLPGSWALALTLLVMATILSPIHLQLAWRRRKRFSLPLPQEAFEWRVGMRQRGALVIASYLLGLIPPNAAFSFLGVLVLASNVANFYIAAEGNLMIDVLAADPRRFLERKIGMALTLFTLFALPLLVAAALRLESHYWLVPSVWGICMLLISSSVLMKYAYYVQGDESRMRSTMNGLILMTSLMLLPSNFYYQFVLWRKAHERLAIYNHDRHA